MSSPSEIAAEIPTGASCTICGGTEFVPGPNGRMSATGRLPRCAGCGSLERHRSIRQAFATIPKPMLAWRRALQFAPDRSIDPDAFRSFEGSRYGGENSIDLQEIPRADGSYDWITLNHVLEFVPDDRKGFEEVVRVSSDVSIIHITFAGDPSGLVTRHWEEPKPPYGRFHSFGADAGEWLGVDRHGLKTVEARLQDPVTEVVEAVHFFCRQRNDAETLQAAFQAVAHG
jgi:hypothetical protein